MRRRRGASFQERAAREPSLLGKAVLVVIAVLLPVQIWSRRGAVAGVVALVVYGAIVAAAVFDHAGLLRWSRRHVVLDALVIAPLLFLALAYLTTLPLSLCALAGVAVAAVIVPVAVRRRGQGDS